MYIFYFLIILVIILLFLLVKDKKELLRKLGMTSTISGIIVIVIGFILNIIFPIFIRFNTSKITNIIFKKFLSISIFFLIIGLFLPVLSKILSRTIVRSNNS